MTLKQLIGWLILLIMLAAVTTIAIVSSNLTAIAEALIIMGTIYGGIALVVLSILLILDEI